MVNVDSDQPNQQRTRRDDTTRKQEEVPKQEKRQEEVQTPPRADGKETTETRSGDTEANKREGKAAEKEEGPGSLRSVDEMIAEKLQAAEKLIKKVSSVRDVSVSYTTCTQIN